MIIFFTAVSTLSLVLIRSNPAQAVTIKDCDNYQYLLTVMIDL